MTNETLADGGGLPENGTAPGLMRHERRSDYPPVPPSPPGSYGRRTWPAYIPREKPTDPADLGWFFDDVEKRLAEGSRGRWLEAAFKHYESTYGHPETAEPVKVTGLRGFILKCLHERPSEIMDLLVRLFGLYLDSDDYDSGNPPSFITLVTKAMGQAFHTFAEANPAETIRFYGSSDLSVLLA